MHSASEHNPGVREAHLLRKRNNPLFPPQSREVSNEMLAGARLEDGLEMDRFMEEFRELVQRAVALDPNTPSETVLELKEQLDQSYQRACALPGDQSEIKQAIRKLLAAMMRAVRAGIGSDAYAARQLEEEELARDAHFDLQEVPLVAALTHADSPVAEDELVPSLLSEDDADLQRCLTLFDETQMASLCHEAGRWLERFDPARQLEDAWRRLAIMQAYYGAIRPDADAN